MEQVPTSILSAERCQLGEGPPYDVATDTDIVERRQFEAQLCSRQTCSHRLGRMASALARVDSKRQLIAPEDGLYVRSVSDGTMVLDLPLEADNPHTRSNDARVHPSGTFWIGAKGRKAKAIAGAMFHRGVIARLFSGITIPNAICFSPDGAVGYFADTAKNKLCRLALDPATGLPRGTPEVLLHHHGVGGLDGAVVDADGLIWNARWGGGCVDVYGPRGEPSTLPAGSGAAGEQPGFRRPRPVVPLVTSAWQDMDEAARDADSEHGHTFPMEVAARGRPEPDVKLAS